MTWRSDLEILRSHDDGQNIFIVVSSQLRHASSWIRRRHQEAEPVFRFRQPAHEHGFRQIRRTFQAFQDPLVAQFTILVEGDANRANPGPRPG